ncbi:MAG TPA: anti-sigma factor [Stellaceae bacterium]|jgi:anti-sigma factor RsiW|nr:anti-sigma factor [Stellaceae bacterium]
MSSERPISEDDLHAYVDGALEAARHAEVAVYLEQHPDVAERIGGYVRLRHELRDGLAPIAEEPVPPELNLRRLIEARTHRRHRRFAWRNAAAAVILLLIGGTGGWVLRGNLPPDRANMNAIAQEAMDSFSVYGADHERPVELGPADKAQLAGWVASVLRHDVTIPDLSAAGYHFMGGRVVPTSHGPAALFMYDDAKGNRIAMLARPAVIREAPMSVHVTSQFCGYAWADNGIGYGLVSGASAEKLHPLANEIRRQIDQNA